VRRLAHGLIAAVDANTAYNLVRLGKLVAAVT
jgi:hypothetical protein